MLFAKSKLLVLTLLIVFSVSFVFTPVVQAQILPDECTGPDAGTKCGVNELIRTLINYSKALLLALGSMALLLFVYGGFVWVTAAGNTARVDKGRKILVGTVVGIVIVLGAFTLVRFVGESLGVTGTDFDRYLDTTSSGSSSSGGVCPTDGDRCFKYNQNIYACFDGFCTDTYLCLYWAADAAGTGETNIHGVTQDHWCRAESSCNSSTIIPGLCPGSPGSVCCVGN
jgi:hypothetical protein